MSETEPVGEYCAAIKGHTVERVEAEFTYVGSLDLSEPEQHKFKIVLSFKEGDSTFSVEHTIGLWDDELYDVLDMSLCLHAIADRDHTVEKLRDVERGTDYTHGVEFVMFQNLHSPCFVELLAKRTRLATGYRILWFFFRQDGSDSNLKIFDLLATPEDVRIFARSLREIHERLEFVHFGTQ